MSMSTLEEMIRDLRSRPQDEVFAEVMRLLDMRDGLGLEIARRVLTGRSHFIRLLRRGLAEADASEIRLWLGATMGRLGPRGVLQELEQASQTVPDQVRRSLYFAAPMLVARQSDLRESVCALARRIGYSDEYLDSLEGG